MEHTKYYIFKLCKKYYRSALGKYHNIFAFDLKLYFKCSILWLIIVYQKNVYVSPHSIKKGMFSFT